MTEDEAGTLVSAGTGAVAGASSAVAGVISGAASGTAGAAALTSGLAAVGSAIGGGMLAGVVVVTAAPTAGAGLAYGCYKIYKRMARL